MLGSENKVDQIEPQMAQMVPEGLNDGESSHRSIWCGPCTPSTAGRLKSIIVKETMAQEGFGNRLDNVGHKARELDRARRAAVRRTHEP